jgi:hypothetical protein
MGLIVIGCALVFAGAALDGKDILIVFGLLVCLVAHPEILQRRQ